MVLTAAGLAHVQEIRSREGALLERLRMQVSAARLAKPRACSRPCESRFEQQLPGLIARLVQRGAAAAGARNGGSLDAAR